ncbi:LysR family transcriptional regulator [Aliamphritea ceti]|uniref:LysR family transcriptional regulator n=1 Tax=Aliamphritea ceti TaxID=1524258 RepID=UPI0021C2FBB9|nr:LysR family transcriptional regulator [Aliamphritea ceti]
MSVSKIPSHQIQELDLKLLRIFLTIVNNGGFSAAQYELNISLSAISAAMTQLEGRLGFKLCERGRSGFQLTEGGKVIHQELLKTIEAIDRFQSVAESFKGDMYGRITIAIDDAIMTNSKCPLFKIIRDFSQTAPNLKLNLNIISVSRMERALLENEINIAIGPFREISDTLTFKLLYEETQYLCAGSGHPAFGVTNVKKLKEIAHESNYAARSYKDSAAMLDDASFEKITSTSKMEALLAYVLSGQYLGYLPRHACHDWLEKNEMWALDPHTFSYKVPIKVVYKRSHDDPRISLFLDSVIELAGK